MGGRDDAHPMAAWQGDSFASPHRIDLDSRRIAVSGAHPIKVLNMAAQLPDEILDRLLEKLSSDDAFRERFQADTRGALESIGVTQDLDEHVAEASVCLQQKGLPSKQTLATARSRASLPAGTSGFSYDVFRV